MENKYVMQTEVIQTVTTLKIKHLMKILQCRESFMKKKKEYTSNISIKTIKYMKDKHVSFKVIVLIHHQIVKPQKKM